MKPAFGFTLIELLVVLAISSLALSVVAPLMQSQVNKAEASAELIEFKTYMQNSAKVAFLRAEPVQIKLEGRRLIRIQGANRVEVDYDKLFFPPQFVQISAKGFTNVTSVLVQTNKKQQEVLLGRPAS